MKHPSFLNRTTCGVPNYLLIAVSVACLAAMIPHAAREALHSNSNRAEDWLPDTYSESTDLAWFRGHFHSGSVLICTWDGCTLGNDEQLRLLERKLSSRLASTEEIAQWQSADRSQKKPTGKWFRLIASGPGLIDQLTGDPLKLNYAEAAARLEGSLVGPRATDPAGKPLGDASRQTCLAVYLAPEGYATNDNMRLACEELERVACDECGIPRTEFRLAGPPADNVAIDASSRNSFRMVGLLAGLIGVVLAYGCFRSIGLTGIVAVTGWLCAGVSLALVYYFGIGEVLLAGLERPHFGTLDAVTMSMPAVIYVLGISAAVHLANYYLDARRTMGIVGAVEEAVRVGWKPCALCAMTTAIGLGSLAASDIVPIKKFGAFTAIGVLMSLAIMFSVLPILLHRFPPRLDRPRNQRVRTRNVRRATWLHSLARQIVQRHAWVAAGGVLVMLLTGIGLGSLESSVQVLKLLNPKSDLIADYVWIEQNLANVVPMEVVVTVPQESCRTGREHAEEGGQHYRMTMLERLVMIRRLAERIEALPEVSRTMSVATLGPEPKQGRAAYTMNESLEENRDRLGEYLKVEHPPATDGGPALDRELWRITARVSAIDDIDYGLFVENLTQQVEPLLAAYRSRDVIVRRLAEAGQKLEGARLCVLFRGPAGADRPDADSPPDLLARLLWESGVWSRVHGVRGGIRFQNLTDLEAPGAAGRVQPEAVAQLQAVDAVLLFAEQTDPIARQLQQEDLPLITFTGDACPEGSAAVAASLDGGPRSMRAAYTGVVPLVFKTQRQLLVSLRESMFLAALTIGLVMTVLLRNPVAGLISMIPNAFPLVAVFGVLGWLGVKIDVGIMMSASVALGVAVDDTIHFLTWFRRGILRGLDHRAATMFAYERCAPAMLQTSLIAGLGMATFALSPFMPTQRFGLMMVTTLAAALVGDLVLLPALLSGPLGRFFAARRPQSAEADAVISTDGDEVPVLPKTTASSLSESFWLRNNVASPTAAGETGTAARTMPHPEPVFAGADGGSSLATSVRLRCDEPSTVPPPHGELLDRLRTLRHEHSHRN